MAGNQAAPLDEIQYSDQNVLGYWQGVHANSVHGYLSESPFFDHTSKNGVLWGQALNDAQTLALYSDRQRLEQTLRQRPGTEYMIVGEPQPVEDQTYGPDTGVWVIRKQERTKRPSPRDDELTTLGTYYITGVNAYQAPSVYDVVGNHLLSAMTSLSKFMDHAAPLPVYSPATGYSWLPPAEAKAAAKSQQNSNTSREGSVAPDASSQLSSSLDAAAGAPVSSTSALDPRDDLLLEQSLRLTLAYGDEYMDENPLRGEPGNFVFTHTKDHLKAKQAQAEAAAAKAKEKEAAEKARTVPAAFSTKPKDETQQEKQQSNKRKSSKVEGKKRRKSKAANSPITGSGTASPAIGASPEAL
ncbi:MED6-domain-containing protein [Myriangium duriaei CBS 260.36]|uniref:Mediator of RNA polymerase II transcription subunit 6 n=1 Tax=Myriangium duriaei CBS 260.36 TaxID=1168546 RepID=A0A9P4J6E2_9PEZI|nr:MED6-domain-containing protein [Myriangium duriaei CBS 260.36]